MNLRSKRTVLVLVGVLAVAVFAAVGAYAYWTTSGSGTGSASTGTDTGVVVNQTSPSSGLYPGGQVALSGDFDNAGPSKQYVTSVSASIDTFSLQADNSKPACTDADFSLSGSPASVGQDIAVGNGVGSWSGISLHMSDAATNQDNCKNITVPLSYTSN
jgi:hypothetical protein